LLYVVDRVHRRSLIFAKLILKVTNAVSILLSIVLVGIPIIGPGVPPYIGYILCGAMQDLTKNPCGPPAGGDTLLWIPDPKGNALIMGLRFIGGCSSLLIYVPALRGALCIIVFEILPSIMFFKDTSDQIREEVGNSFLHRARPHTTLRKYKELQLLTSMFNEIYQNDFFGKTMACGVLIMVSSGFFLISMYHVNPIVIAFGGPITLTMYILVIVIFTLASKVWTNSVEFKSAWIRNHQFAKLSVSKKHGKSIQNLKIKIGSSNFVERNTPFILVSFCIEQTVSLLLLNG
jgi:hypothetical protein